MYILLCKNHWTGE